MAESGLNIPQTTSRLSIIPSSQGSYSSDEGSFLSDATDAHHSDHSEEMRTAVTRVRGKPKRQEDKNDDKVKSLVDPRKYKTRMCRNWKLTGECPYEHTCCFAHGEVEMRTMHQNNTVLSSLGYFSGIMLLAMKDEKSPVKEPRQGRRPPPKLQSTPQPAAGQGPHALSASPPAAPATPYSPIVHSPYSVPEGSFSVESSPSSPLATDEMPMPTYSLRMESLSSMSPLSPYPPPPYFPEYSDCGRPFRGPHPYSHSTPLGSPLTFVADPGFPDSGGYTPAHPESNDAQANLEAQQAVMEKHPAMRTLQSGDLSHTQLQKALQDILHTPGAKPRRARCSPPGVPGPQ